MPGNTRVLGSPTVTGIPRVSHDPLWTDDLTVTFRMDTTAEAGFVRPAYGDYCPGWVDPGTEQTLYQSMQVVDIVALDDKFIDVTYRDIPGVMMYQWWSLSDLTLPSTLTDIVVDYNKTSGAGSSSHPSSQQSAAASGPGTVSMNPSAQAQGSAAIIPDIQPAITDVWSRDIPTRNFTFQAPNGSSFEYLLARITSAINAAKTTVTISQATPGVVSGIGTSSGFTNGSTVLLSTNGILPAPLVVTQVYYVVNAASTTVELALTQGGSSINTTSAGSGIHQAVAGVIPNPIYKPKYYWLTAIGQHISASIEADSFVSASTRDGLVASALSSEYGNGYSKEVGITVRQTRVGPVLNAALSGWLTTDTETITVSADASTPAVTVNGTTVINAISNSPTPLSLTATGSVLPSSISATSSAIPTAGLVLTELNPSIKDDRLIFVHAGVVDFSLINA